MGILFNTFREAAERFPDKTALVTQSGTHSYASLLSQATKWAVLLYTRYGIHQPRVALLTENPFHTITASFGIARLDGNCVPTNTQLHAEQQLANWQTTDVKIVIYEPAFEHKINANSKSGLIFISTQEVTGTDASTKIPDTFPWSERNDFLIAFSSGSTGTPKPTILSQNNKLLRAQQSWDLYYLTSDDVVLCASPYFHSLGQRLVYVALLLGGTLVYITKITPKIWLSYVSEHKVSFAISVTSHLYAVKDALLENALQLQSLKAIVTSSAPIDTDFKKKIFDAIGCDFHEIYGATEIAIATNLTKDQAVEKYASVGLPCSNIDVRILNEQGDVVPVGTIGEIAVKSPLIFQGYYKQPEATEASFVDDYFLTGDLGYIDEDGFLYYVSRQKDVIISGGINIYPKTIESVILQNPLVHEVAVIGVKDKLFGEVAIAICVTENNKNIAGELHRLADQNLAPYQCPLKYYFSESLPLTPTGKVSKMALRDKYNAYNEDWTMPLRLMMYGE
jgi:acyl-CoA synthetase (AMP-forming)/AMP-acid ligase II